MKVETTLIVFVGVLTVILFGATKGTNDSNLNSQRQRAVAEGHNEMRCLPEAEVLGTLRKISEASSQSEADQGRNVVLELGRSPKCRDATISSIMKYMDQPNAVFKGHFSLFNMWRTGAGLLGELKAVQAVDLLIAHFDLSSGVYSTTMSHQPAFQAVISIGPAAISKLGAVLQGSPDRNARMFAVYCISAIGGRDALQALNKALPSESNRCVSEFIRASIDNLDKKNGQRKGDNGKWFLAFNCTD